MKKYKKINNLSALQFNENCVPVVESLCDPLRKNFGITHFGCIRIFEDGKILRIANNMQWTKKYFECEFYNDLEIYNMAHVPLNKCLYLPLIGDPFNSHCKTLCCEFNIWNFMLIYERFSTYGDLWFFGANKDNTEIINFYLNNKELLKYFTFYFKEKAAGLFKINHSSHLISTNIFPLKEIPKESKEIDKFTREIRINKYFFGGQHKDEFLSNREVQCLLLFSQGITMRDIGKKLLLSPRTVETYIHNIKYKLNCHTRSELISTLSKMLS